jgi:glycerol-3-phosphate acyltransferase PlsY
METGTIVRGVVVVIAAYLIGGIPWGIIVARLVGGPDPRTIGSGRTGGANVLRALGPGYAILSGLLDLAKGIVAVLVARLVGGGPALEVFAALAAIVGHSRSPFIGFQGGRGVAPGVGGLLMIEPIVVLAIAPVFFIAVAISRYSSLGSLLASASAGAMLVVLTAVQHLSPVYAFYGVAGAGLIWYFHRDNIQRLLAGTERKIGAPPQPR